MTKTKEATLEWGGAERKLERPFEYWLETYTSLVMGLSAVCVGNIYWPNRIGAGRPHRLNAASLGGRGSSKECKGN